MNSHRQRLVSNGRVHPQHVRNDDHKIVQIASFLLRLDDDRTYHSDSAIIERDGKQYIIVALANDPNGSKWLEKIIVEADRIIFANDTVELVAHAGSGESSPHEAEPLRH